MLILFKFVDALFQIYFFMLIGRILLSWIPELRDNKIALFIIYYTDPYLNFFRKFIPPIGMIDISPLFAFIAFGLIEKLIKKLLLAFM